MTDRITQTSHRKHCTSQFKAAKLLAALAVAGFAQQGFAAAPAPNALPTGGQVVAGAATIATAGNTMNINQSSQRAVVNWNSFDVGSQAKVNFNQPNAQAATLNYVNSASKSMINGAVNSNGQVIFVNNNGVVFGKGAEVNVGGMVATTMNISATEFMAGNATQVFEGGTTGKVINRGNITGNNINSYIALMAPQVKNTGVITATMGGNNAVALVSGQKVSLTFSGSQLVSVSVDASVVNALISNKLLIKAGSGQVIIAANSAQELMGSVIKNTGVISASDINTSGGKISLTADSIEQNGTVEANSAQANGGNISLKGNNITLASGSKTTATGATAGGNINVGVNQANTLANTVAIEANAIVDASATQNGNGGNINIWSQIKTLVAGNLFAKGGAQGGNGGHIETSSKGNVAIAASAAVDTSAPKGRSGMWVIDPIALIIDSAAASAISNALNTTSVTLDATGSACAFGSCTNSQSALIRIMAGADIYSSNTATSLNLIATGGQIDIHSNITAGSVYAVAQAINVYGSVNTNGGSNSNIYLAGAIINILGNINSNGNNQNNSSSSNLNSANTITGANRRNGQNGLNAESNTYLSNGGLINILATGDITVDTNSYISSNGVNGGVVTITSAAGKVTINGIVDSIGKSNTAGNIMIAGKTETNLIGSLISVEGLNVGGMINLGQINNLGNGTILAPPATAPPALITFVQDSVAAATSNSATSITSSNINIDSQTGINAPNGNIVVFGEQIQINNSSITATNGTIAIGREGYSTGALAGLTAVSNSTLIANRVETSGDLLGTQNNRVVASEWLLDPTNVTIAAGGTSTGGSLAAALAAGGVVTIANTDIVNAVNAGGTVNVVYTGTMTQTGALAFAPASGVTGTLILNNLSGTMGTATAVGLNGGITNGGAGTIDLRVFSNGLITLSGGVTSTSGVINVAFQSAFQATTSAGFATNIKINAPITTRGGYLVLDATGGTINGLGTTNPTITRGTSLSTNGKGGGISFLSTAVIKTTTTGAIASATTTGGNFVAATSGTFELNTSAKLDIGGSVNLSIEGGVAATSGGGYGFLIGAGTSYLQSTGSIYMDARTPWGLNTDVFLQGGSLTSFAGGITILAKEANSVGGYGPFAIQAPIAAYGPITISSEAVGNVTPNPTINSWAAGTITSTTGLVQITTTSSITGVYSATLAGLISAPKVIISSTNNVAGGLGLSMVGATSGVTITADPTGVIIYPSAGDALSVTTSVGTNGQAGGINITGGNIINQSNGGSVSFVTNGDLVETSAVNFSTANTSGASQSITYDTRTGNQTSLITTGTFTYNATGATSKVNYISESNGSTLTLGATTVSGYINVDNTCPSCATSLTPASATAGMTTTSGVKVTGALSSGDYIYLNGLNNSSTVNAVDLAANTVTVTSASAATNAITIIGNHNTANIGNPGITSTGAIANQSNAGGNILFQSNGDISQTGALTLAANNSGNAQSVTYDTTSGNLDSSITAGALSATAGTSALNYIEKASGAAIGVGALSVSGYILLDNTYGCTGTNCTPATGYINYANASTSAAASTGVNINGVISTGAFSGPNAITVNGVSSGASGTYAINLATGFSATATTGDINFTGLSPSTYGVYVLSPITANNGSINIIGVSGSTSSAGVLLGQPANMIASGNILISGSDLATSTNAAYGIWIYGNATTFTKIAAGGNVTISGFNSNTATLGTYAIYTGLQGPLYVKSGGDTVIAGSTPSGTSATVKNLYLASLVTNVGGNLWVEGATLQTQTNSSGTAIPNVATAVANSVALNGPAGGATAGIGIDIQTSKTITDGTAFTGINAIGNIWMSGSGGAGGININGVPITSTSGAITLTGTTGAATSVGFKDVTGIIKASNGVVTITGNSTTGTAVSDTALITGNSIIVTGNATALPTTIVSLNAMTINACAAGVDCTSHDLEVYAWGGGAQTSATNTGGTTGISQTGAIAANANGGSILFKSNNIISQTGAVTIAANTSGTNSLVSYDTTFGTRLSTIDGGALTFTGTSSNYINYNNLASGAPILISINSPITIPGSITLDNTYLNGVQGGINTNNAWQYGTIAAAQKGIYIASSLTASNGIYIRGVVGATTASVVSCCNAVDITQGLSGALTTLQTTGTFAAGTSAIEIIGIQPIYNMTSGANAQNAVKITGNVAINNNSVGGKTNIVAISGNYNDIVSITNASTAGSIDVSAIGLYAQIITISGTVFTQNSNAGIFIATSQNGNVIPPQIINNGTGPVVIEAGAYYPVGTVSTGTCSASACGQITTVAGNTITSALGDVYLYAGSPGTTAGTTTTTAALNVLDTSLNTLTFSNTLFGQAYAAGNVPATLIPLDTLAALNTANVAPGTGYTSWTTTSANGPVIQFRIQPTVQANLSGNVTKVYGTNDPLATAGNLATVGSLDYQLNALFVKNATVNPGYVANGSTGCLNEPSGCMKTTVNGLNFFLPMDNFINSLQATLPTPRASYGTVAGEQVNGTSATAYTSSYAYNLTSNHGVLVSSGISVNLQPASGTVGLVITPAPLTITASNQTIQAGDVFTAGTTAFTTSALALAPNGVVLGDAISGVTLAAPTYTQQTSAGTYPINASTPVFSTGSASNYAITYAPGTLTTTSNLIITITALAESKIYGSSAISSPSSITYNGSGVAVVSGPASALYTITGLPVGGTYTIDSLTFTSAGGIASASVAGSPYTVTPSAVSITTASGSPSIAGASYIYQPGLMTVTPRPITITATPVTTTYGSATPIAQTGYTVSSPSSTAGLVAGDAITGATVNYVGASTSTTVPGTLGAGTYSSAIVPSAATGTGGFNATNYAITYAPANLVVNKLAVTVTANAQSTVYGTDLALGTTAFTNSIGTLPNGDTIASATLKYGTGITVPATTNAGSYTIAASAATGTGGFGSANYDVTYATGPLTVTPAPITISAAAPTQSVVYNGSVQTFNAATGLTISGLKNGETAVLGSAGLGSGTNVGSYTNTVSSSLITAISGVNALLSNYIVTYSGAQASLTIVPAPLTITGATTSVTYDAAAHTNSAPIVTGLQGSDAVALPMGVLGAGTNAGTYADVLAPVFTTGSANNYTITTTNGALTITPKAATITGNTTVNQYNGALQTNTYTTTGIITGDAVTVGGVATATHVSQGTVPDVFAVSGASAGNYAFTYAPGSITITPAPLTVTGANTTAVYNKTTQTNSAATVTGLKTPDTVTIGGTYGSGINAGVYTDSLSVGLSNPSDYAVSITNGTHTITPAIITVNGITAQNKVYDSTTAATLNVGTITTTGVLPGDTVTLQTSTLSGVFTDKNVGIGKTVLISGVVLAGTDSANYQLSGGANTTTTANITPAPLTITGVDLTTTYNASVQSLAAPTVVGLIAGDNVTVAGNATGTNAGTYAAAYTASGVDAGNYTVTANAPVLTINKANLVVTANNAAKIYGQTDPTFTATVSGLQGSDTSSVINPAYTVTRVIDPVTGQNAGTYTITAAGPSAATNYNITYAPGVFTIAPAGSLIINLNAVTTTYGTAATPTISSVQGESGGVFRTFTTTGGNIYTDSLGTTITITPSITGATVTSNVGAYSNAVTGTYTGSTSNYTAVTTVTNTLNITPAPLALTVADVSKVYNANPIAVAQITAGTLTGGVISGVTVTGGALMNIQTLAGLGGVTFSGSAIGAINVGSYAINGSVGSGFSNYTVTITNGTATVTPAPLTITGANSSTAYNGAIQTNTAATVTGLQGSDSVTVANYATGLHAGLTTDALTISGTLSSNYTPTYVNGTLTITPASLVVTGAVNSYAYNGAVQTNSGASISGLKGSDTATIAGYAEATHVSQGAVPDSLVATLSNPADYTITYNQGSLSITPIQINAVVASQTVQYNAAEQTTSYTVTGLKGSDTATAFSGTATGTNVGSYTSNLTLVASSDYYVGTITNGTLTITPAPLTITSGLTAQNKVYDTTTVASINATATQTLTGVLGSDLISVSSTGPYTGTFSQSNVGTNLNVAPVTTTTMINGVAYTTMAGVTLTGAAASNYYVAGLTTPIAANITPAPLTIAAGVTAQSKVYDGTTAATITASTQTLSGVLGGDAVSVSSTGPYTGTFSQSNVGSNLTVTPSLTTTTIGGVDYSTMSGVTLGGAAAGNYYVTGISAPVVANITPYVIVPGSTTGPRIVATAIDKVYDTTTVANGSLAMAGLFGSDVVSVGYSAASFANPNVAAGITVTFTGASLSGADAANYTIGTGAVTAPANITPAPLTITANTQSSFVTQAIGALSYSTVGLLGGDTVTAATLATTATSSSVAGNNYPITVSAATISSGASNYDITYVPSTYTIIPAGQLRVQTSGAITPYGTAATYANPTASYLTTSGAVISNLSFVSATTAGGITTYTYADGASGTVSFNLSPTGTTTSTSGNIVIGTYPLAAANFASTSGNLTAGSAVVSGDLTVTPLAVNIAAAPVSRVYNGTTQSQAAAVATPSILSGDLVTVSGIATGRNVGIYNSNLVTSGADAANYSFTYTNAALTITPYVIDPNATTGPRITATANNKVYDASTAATGALGMTGLFAGDVVTASYTTADFASKNVANGITVTFNGVTLSDPNYAVGSGAVTATANITPAPLTIATGLAALNKVYDTTTAATISATGVQTLSGLLGADAVTVASTGPYTGTFSQSNVGTTLAVTPTTTSTTINGVAYTTMAGVTLTGADAGNYYVSGPSSTLTANITGKAITIYALDQASFYSKPLNTLGYAPVVGLLSGASVTGATLVTTATATGANSAAGQYPITASAATGTGLGNYLITYASATYTIVPAGQLLVSTAGVTTTYGTGTATAGPIINPAQPTATYIASNGAVISSLTFVSSSTSGTVVSYVFRDSANAQISFNLTPVTTRANISSSGNIKIGNYDYLASSLSAIPAGLTTTATVTTGALTVMPLAVTVTATAATTAYNGAVQSQVPATLTPNIVAGDLVTVNGIATGKTVGVYGSALSTAGADIGNYQFTYVNNNLTITPYIINYGAGGTGPGIAASASNKVYNTNTLANGALSMVNLFPGDSVTANFASATFATPNVGNNITVTFNGVTLSGPDALNYAVGNTPVTTTAKITPAPVTISGLVAANKQYDGNTAAVITGTPTITGLLGSDTSTLTGSVLSGTFATANPGTGVVVTANLTDLILGNGNYYIADVTFPLTAEIIAPPQQISNMAILQQQVAADVVRRDPENLIYKGELLYVRDKDNMPEYLQAIEVPSSGAFKFPVPDQIIQDLIDLSGENKGATAKLATYKLLRLPKGTKVYATLANGAALPAGITFNSATQTFAVPKLGNVTLPISVKLTLKRGNQTLSEKVLVVTK